jgi:ABC-type lipoprotein export system ATPase subunit
MKIELKNILPTPLSSLQHGANSIWGNNALLKPSSKILLNASSGKGKSTFTMTVFGLRDDYTGSICYDDRDIKTFNEDEWVEIRQNKISVIFQDLQLFPNLTVEENLQLKNDLTGFKTSTEMFDLLAQLEVDHKWNDRCGLLSMGQQQRVAIVRAMCQPFEWLIMDEPFSHLDELNSRKCLDLIAKECDAQKAGFVLTSLDADNRFPYDYELSL